jgi:hypothetical protein
MTGPPPLPPHLAAEAKRLAEEAPPLSDEARGELRSLLRPIPQLGRKAS